MPRMKKCLRMKVLIYYLVTILLTKAKGDWIEISQTLSKPASIVKVTTPTYFTKTFATVATKKSIYADSHSIETTTSKPKLSTTKFHNTPQSSLKSTSGWYSAASELNTSRTDNILTTETNSFKNFKPDRLFIQEKIEDILLKGKDEDPESTHFPNTEQDFSYGGFLPYLQNIQSTLMKNTHRNIKSKVTFLANLKDNLFINIKEKISKLWNTNQNREAREYHEKEDYHMDFPSNEGALMTIGFLTFAVFLIKLVLKLIYALKNKNNVNGMITTTVMPTVFGRKKREAFNEETAKILHYIEKFNF